MKRFQRVTVLGGALLAMVLLAACAPTDLVVKPAYQPVSDIKGSGGPLVVALSGDSAIKAGGAERVQFVYGEIRDTDGKVKGNVVSPAAPAAMVRDALQQELLKAGYAVQLAETLPKDVEQGVMVTTATIALDEITSLVKIEVECKVGVTLELWKKGALVRKLSYGKTVSDFAVRDREKLHQQLLQKALGAVMKDATTDLVTYLK